MLVESVETNNAFRNIRQHVWCALCGPGHTGVPTAKIMRLCASQKPLNVVQVIRSKEEIHDALGLSAFTSVLRTTNLWSDHPGSMLIPGVHCLWVKLGGWRSVLCLHIFGCGHKFFLLVSSSCTCRSITSCRQPEKHYLSFTSLFFTPLCVYVEQWLQCVQ